MDDMPANFFGIRTETQSQTQSFLLVTPQSYTGTNVALQETREAHVSAHAVKRLQTLPGIKGLTLQGKYPIAEVMSTSQSVPLDHCLCSTASGPLPS